MGPIFTPSTNPVDWFLQIFKMANPPTPAHMRWGGGLLTSNITNKMEVYFKGSDQFQSQAADTSDSTDGEVRYTPTIHSSPPHPPTGV